MTLIKFPVRSPHLPLLRSPTSRSGSSGEKLHKTRESVKQHPSPFSLVNTKSEAVVVHCKNASREEAQRGAVIKALKNSQSPSNRTNPCLLSLFFKYRQMPPGKSKRGAIIDTSERATKARWNNASDKQQTEAVVTKPPRDTALKVSNLWRLPIPRPKP